MQNRITLMATGLGVGGAELQLYHLARLLRARSWAVSVICLCRAGEIGHQLKTEGFPVYAANATSMLSLFWRLPFLARALRELEPDVVHAHMVHANLVSRLLRACIHTPVLVCTAHSINEKGRARTDRMRALLYRLSDSLCDVTTNVCEAGVRRYVQIGAAPANRILCVPNGVDTQRYAPDAARRERVRASLNANTHFIWLNVARLASEKNQELLLRAFQRVLKASPRQSRLLIAGDGPLRDRLQALVEALDLAPHIQMLGSRSDVPDLMKAADAFVLSSDFEGMPMVLLEAQASGLPVVTTDVGGNREVVRHDETGFLVPPGDVARLSAAMVKVMQLPKDRLARMQTLARERIKDCFSIEHVVEVWDNLYHELLARKARPFCAPRS